MQSKKSYVQRHTKNQKVLKSVKSHNILFGFENLDASDAVIITEPDSFPVPTNGDFVK